MTLSASVISKSPSPSELALLAARAAVELELLATNHNASLKEVYDLGRVLKGLLITGAEDSRPGKCALWNTEAGDVVDRALVSLGETRANTMDELNGEVERLAASLCEVSSTSPVPEVTRLRDLSVALARAAQAQDPAPVYTRPGWGSAG